MFLTTVFALLSLLASTLTVIGIIKPSIFIKNKEMKGKRQKISTYGSVLSFVSLVLCIIFLPEDLSESQNPDNNKQEVSQSIYSTDPKIKKFKTIDEFLSTFSKHFDIIDKYKVISPTEIELYIEHTPNDVVYFSQWEIYRYAIFSLVKIFPHVDIDEITVHIKPKFIKDKAGINTPLSLKNKGYAPDLSKYNFTIHAKRKDVLAYLKKNFDIDSFENFVDTSDKTYNKPIKEPLGLRISSRFVRIVYPRNIDSEQKTKQFIQTFTIGKLPEIDR